MAINDWINSQMMRQWLEPMRAMGHEPTAPIIPDEALSRASSQERLGNWRGDFIMVPERTANGITSHRVTREALEAYRQRQATEEGQRVMAEQRQEHQRLMTVLSTPYTTHNTDYAAWLDRQSHEAEPPPMEWLGRETPRVLDHILQSPMGQLTAVKEFANLFRALRISPPHAAIIARWLTDSLIKTKFVSKADSLEELNSDSFKRYVQSRAYDAVLEQVSVTIDEKTLTMTATAYALKGDGK